MPSPPSSLQVPTATQRLDTQPGEARPQRPSVPHAPDSTVTTWVRTKPFGLAALGTALLIAGGIAGWTIRGPLADRDSTATRLEFQEDDWLLVTDVVNQTGDPAMGGATRYLLERELKASTFPRVVSRERIIDTLHLLRRRPDATVDPALGREICLRDGAIRAFLVPEVRKADSTLVASASLHFVHGGVETLAEEAGETRELPAVVRRLARDLREVLGGAGTSELPPEPPEQPSLPSLGALSLYSDALDLGISQRWAAAEPLARQAIALDPDLAPAHNWLAWSLFNQGRPAEEFLPSSARAVALADRASLPERYFILASHLEWTGEHERALATLEALHHAFPDHFWGANNLGHVYMRAGRVEESARLLERAAELRPHSHTSALKAASAVLAATGDPVRARPHVDAANALPWTDARRMTWAQLFPLFESWVAGDLAGVRKRVLDTERGLQATPGPSAIFRRAYLAQFRLTLGELRAAASLAQAIPEPVLREHLLAVVALARDDRVAMGTHAMRTVSTLPRGAQMTDPAMASLLGLAGHRRGLQTLRDWVAGRGIAAAHVRFVEGELALSAGNLATGVPALSDAHHVYRWLGLWQSHLAAASLARALDRQGDPSGALRVLEDASHLKGRSYIFDSIGPTGWLWLRNQVELAAFYERLGRRREAQETVREVSEYLRFADEDHPLLRRLRALRLDAGLAADGVPPPRSGRG